MIANYQSGPAIYKYLKENKGIKTVAFVAANESDPLSQRDSGIEAAKALGLEVVSTNDAYQNDTRDFTPVLTPIVMQKPDLLVLSGVAPGNAPLLIRAREQLSGLHFHRNCTGRQGSGRRRGRTRQRFHLGGWCIHAGNRIRRDEGIRRPLYQGLRRI